MSIPEDPSSSPPAGFKIAIIALTVIALFASSLSLKAISDPMIGVQVVNRSGTPIHADVAGFDVKLPPYGTWKHDAVVGGAFGVIVYDPTGHETKTLQFTNSQVAEGTKDGVFTFALIP